MKEKDLRPHRCLPRIGLLCGALLAVVVGAQTPAFGQSGHPDWNHVRALSKPARQLLACAVNASSLIGEMMDRLEASDVFVLIQTSDEEAPGISAWLKFVGGSQTSRFVLINLPAQALQWENVPMLGHELTHALEIAADAGARDAWSVRDLFARIGWNLGDGHFETAAARSAEARVRWELARGPWTTDGSRR